MTLGSDSSNMAQQPLEHEQPISPQKNEPPPSAAAATTPSTTTTTTTTSETKPEALPALSSKDFKAYNRMAEHMNWFHENFRRTWNVLYTAASSGQRPAGMSIRTYLRTAEEFAHHLTTHHTIEEMHIFPVLARKMARFRDKVELLDQHRQIHEGLERLEAYIDRCKSGETELRMEEMKMVLDSFGGVLWRHLDEEVLELGAENMRKYWTLEEMRRMPM